MKYKFFYLLILCVFLSSCNDGSNASGKHLLSVESVNDVMESARVSRRVAGVSEGDVDNLVYFQIAIPQPLPDDVTFFYETRNGTALAGEDYCQQGSIRR